MPDPQEKTEEVKESFQDWDALAKEIEEGKETPAAVAKKYGFTGFTHAVNEAPPEWKRWLRSAMRRNQNVRCGYVPPHGRRFQKDKKESEGGEVEEKRQDMGSERTTVKTEKAEEAAKEVAEARITKEEKKGPEGQAPRTWLWLGVAVVALGVLFWLMRRNRGAAALREENLRSVERPQGEEPPPVSEGGKWDKYRVV